MGLCKKPQKPLQKGEEYFYPLTSIDQVVVEEGNTVTRLPAKFDRYYTKKEIDEKLKNFTPGESGGGSINPGPDWGGNGGASGGSGDMQKSIYDPQNKSTDIFKYAEEASKIVNPNMILGYKDGAEGSLIGAGIDADSLGGYKVADFIRSSQLESLLSRYIPSIENNAGSHNSIFRGSFLGNFISDDQYISIKTGSFENLFLGDYWQVGNIYYIIIGFDWKKLSLSASENDVPHVNILATTFSNNFYQGNQIQSLLNSESNKQLIPFVPGLKHIMTCHPFEVTSGNNGNFKIEIQKNAVFSLQEIFGYCIGLNENSFIIENQFPFFKYVSLSKLLEKLSLKDLSIWLRDQERGTAKGKQFSYNNIFSSIEKINITDSLPFLYYFCLTVV